MADNVIKAVIREEFGKGAARRLRRDKMIPAVMYGHGSAPQHVALPAHATTLALRTANALLTIELDKHRPQLALARQIQRDPVKDIVEHVDLVIVKRGEKVSVEVPLVIIGEVAGQGVVLQDQNTITLEVEATSIPANIEVSVDGLEAGAVVTAKDLGLPEGAVFSGDPDTLIVSVQVVAAQDTGESAGDAEESDAEEDIEE